MLAHGLSPNTDVATVDLKNLLLRSDNKLKAGFIGTPMLCEILSETGITLSEERIFDGMILPLSFCLHGEL